MRSFGDDAALRAIADAVAEEGVAIVSPVALLPELLAPRGRIGARGFSESQRADAEAGRAAARALGAADIGQTVVVRRGVVLAVEAVEGTDACIARGGALARGAGAVVVKTRKPQQDLRFDLPAVGPATVRALESAGCAALAVEAGGTLLLDREELIAVADRAGIAVEGI
jgi:DUF1009 family protein